MKIRYAAQRLGLSEDAFKLILPDLEARGFPRADETTGNFDLQAIDEWRRLRHAVFFRDSSTPRRGIVSERIRQTFGRG